jgi:hypothetical protein
MTEAHIHRSDRGDMVRSKSELLIANKLHERLIDYVYEQPLQLSEGRTRVPDFTIYDRDHGVTYYWEHLMALNDSTYREHCDRNRSEYISAGIKPWQEGGGPKGTLIETQDGGINDAMIEKVIDVILKR